MNARPEVVTFARAMEIKLSNNEKRDPKWQERDAKEHARDLRVQLIKMESMLESGKFTEEQFFSVAANIANYAMFATGTCGALSDKLHNKLLMMK